MKNSTSSPFLKKAEIVLGVLVALIVILRMTGQLGMYNIPTNAMAPFVRKGDTIIVQALTLHAWPAARGEVVTFTTKGIKGIYSGDGQPQIYIKRLVGLSGDRLQFKGGMLNVNGRPVDEYFDASHIRYEPLGLLSGGQEYTVPANHLFMMGDNSGNSFDSRYWGPLPISNIRQRHWFHLKRGPAIKDEDLQP